MRRKAPPIHISIVLVAVLAMSATTGAVYGQSEMTARQIIERTQDLFRGDSQQGVYRMEIVRPDWSRTLKFQFWAEGTERSFIVVEEPAKEKGVAFLKVGREMWNFIPRINRVIKIPPSMMMQSWMGSDFTNDDLVRESSELEDYDHNLLGVDTLDAGVAWRVELVPKEGVAVAWERVVEWISQDNYVPMRAYYYSERGDLVRTIEFSDVRQFGDRVVPARMELTEPDKPGQKTILVLEESVFDGKIPASTFSQANLRRPRS